MKGRFSLLVLALLLLTGCAQTQTEAERAPAVHTFEVLGGDRTDRLNYVSLMRNTLTGQCFLVLETSSSSEAGVALMAQDCPPTKADPEWR